MDALAVADADQLGLIGGHIGLGVDGHTLPVGQPDDRLVQQVAAAVVQDPAGIAVLTAHYLQILHREDQLGAVPGVSGSNGGMVRGTTRSSNRLNENFFWRTRLKLSFPSRPFQAR